MKYQPVTKLQKTEKIMKALANEKRLNILKTLRKEEHLPVWLISSKLSMPFKTVSKNLRILYDQGLIEKEYDSTEVFYSISEKIPKSIKNLISHL